jgi:hypothetical protein
MISKNTQNYANKKPSETPKNLGGGRPTRAEATAKALKTPGIDPESIEPRHILSAIAADTSAPAAARVAACKMLLADIGRRCRRLASAT